MPAFVYFTVYCNKNAICKSVIKKAGSCAVFGTLVNLKAWGEEFILP
jgi:hypothetical protein